MTSPFWGNCPGLCDGVGFCEQRQGGAGTKPFPDLLCFALWLGWCCEHPQNQRDVWFSVLPSQGTCEGGACDAVFEDLLDQELMRGDVIKASNQHDAARGDGKVRHPKPSATEAQAAAGQG